MTTTAGTDLNQIDLSDLSLWEDGPPHERTFSVSASVAGEVVGEGVGRTKKAAEQEAARAALGPDVGGG